jgi:hypothetical protein
MPTYHMNEGAFELPDGAVTDRTTHVVEARVGGHVLTLVVVRSPLPEGKSLRQVAQLRVLDEMSRLAGYRVTAEEETGISGLPALEFTSRWRHDGGVVHQRQVHFVRGRTWIYLALSAKLAGREAADAWFDQIRRSIRLRTDI